MRARQGSLSQTLLPFLSLTTLARHSRWADDLLFEPLVAPVTQHRPRPRGRTVTIGCDLRRQTPYETALVSKGSGRTTLFAQNYPDGASNDSKTLYSGTPSRSQPPAENWVWHQRVAHWQQTNRGV